MRVATLRTSDGCRAARIDGDRAILLQFADVRDLLERPDWLTQAKAGGPDVALETVAFAPLVPRPDKFFCVGFNYLAHIAELKMEPPAYPSLFAKFARALIGARDPIAMPHASEQVAWEVELGVVIGRSVRAADRATARAAIAGYTIVNDVSVRDWQMRTRQALQGKTWERTTPLGPVLVTPDEVDDAVDLRIQTLIDGAIVQDSTTADMQFSPADLISYISTFVTLDPGDIISTGSPSGVGLSRTPPRWLRSGETLTTRIAGIGELVNRCVDEDAWAPATSKAP
ncbi:5-carboxymethyl-2-hydroxymuconate isomerase [Vulcanimicrobium alpinum]|uniref:5-carboxymethyl-2-hydroxymuconate isomerase n=1 Tax=Vulcanimicrobium alpinum TaxID=3016050 RepID=A0AAN1XWG8_UNVUL|nr:fumarylacetoacetate hydrolase family protein [Vulcanimicrobium alpinum]BDE06662.1 5-carboxymethyl-2-hydroxymuconate isomerase [Vulcanimicrobium alpinum]